MIHAPCRMRTSFNETMRRSAKCARVSLTESFWLREFVFIGRSATRAAMLADRRRMTSRFIPIVLVSSRDAYFSAIELLRFELTADGRGERDAKYADRCVSYRLEIFHQTFSLINIALINMRFSISVPRECQCHNRATMLTRETRTEKAGLVREQREM